MSEEKEELNRYTLCWDCAKACGGCSWSNSLIPVRGWEVDHRGYFRTALNTFFVVRCPEFQRDAIGGGMKWLNKALDELGLSRAEVVEL